MILETDVNKIVVLGDLHLGVRGNSVEWNDIQMDYLEKHFIKQIEDAKIDPKKDILIQLGDIFHYRESVNVRISTRAEALFKLLATKFKKIYIILGNHDIYYKDRNDVNSVKPLTRLASNIVVFEKPETISINNIHEFLMIPWTENYSTFSDLVKDSKSSYIFCHADVKGFAYNRWVKVEHGVESSIFKDCNRVYSGHIHIRQENGNILYTGTPYQMDRGDRDNDKGFYLLDVNGPKIKETFIENKFSPTYLKYELYDILEMNKEEVIKLFNNNFIDLMIENSFASKFSISTFIEYLGDNIVRKIEPFTYGTIDKKVDTTVIGKDAGPFELFEAYAASREYSTSLKDSLTNYFSELMKRQLDTSEL